MRSLISMVAIAICMLASFPLLASDNSRPNIIFVMADDMGWGQTGYQDHPVLKTPNLDAMAENGLRFDRFYAACAVCSPTRASVLTGRQHMRSGTQSHGYVLRHQEKTIAQALKQAGYVTGHFGKWHLDGLRGAGVPILEDDPYNPGSFGFDHWLSVTNFFDKDPLMSRMGEFEQKQGDSSEVVVDEAIKFIRKHHESDAPIFTVIWFGTPHSPFKALDKDFAEFPDLDQKSANHYGELVAMDRSMGTLRKALREMEIADNTLLVFCSDNGGLPGIKPETVGGLRGNKGSLFEGGIRVPAIIEWPARVKPRVTSYPACTTDLFPTVADLLGLPDDVFVQPIDGVSLKPLLAQEIGPREKPLGFLYNGKGAWIDNNYKLVADKLNQGFALYDLEADPKEKKNLSKSESKRFQAMQAAFATWKDSVDASFAGKDYPEGELSPPDPSPRHWVTTPEYAPYKEMLQDRWEYAPFYERAEKGRIK